MEFDIITTISTVGFPIVACLVLFKQNGDLSKSIASLNVTLEAIKTILKVEDEN